MARAVRRAPAVELKPEHAHVGMAQGASESGAAEAHSPGTVRRTDRREDSLRSGFGVRVRSARTPDLLVWAAGMRRRPTMRTIRVGPDGKNVCSVEIRHHLDSLLFFMCMKALKKHHAALEKREANESKAQDRQEEQRGPARLPQSVTSRDPRSCVNSAD
jgi:hypothetical protein